MNFFKDLIGRDEPIRSYEDFWAWFTKNERRFYAAVKANNNVVQDVFDKISPKLAELQDGFFLLAGMQSEETAELVITADGDVKNIAACEDLVAAAPPLDGWLFTALKQEADGFTMRMGPFEYSDENILFSANETWDYPDEIDLVFTHSDLNEENEQNIKHGIYIFLDNYLGELSFSTDIDNVSVVSREKMTGAPRPLSKLKKYLADRKASFLEKYVGSRYDTENDSFSMMEAELESGDPLLAVINTTLLSWDRKASHPWIAIFHIGFPDGGNRGMPDEQTYAALSAIEDEILAELKDGGGSLNIGRETAKNVRSILFACKDFRLPSKVLRRVAQKHSQRYEIEFEVYKDKYWRSFDHLIPENEKDRAAN